MGKNIFFVIFVIVSIFYSSCVNKNTTIKSNDNIALDSIDTISQDAVVAVVKENIIEVVPMKYDLSVKFVVDTICIDSFAIYSGKEKLDIDIDKIVRRCVVNFSKKNNFILPYIIAKNNGLMPLTVKVGNNIFEDINYKYNSILPLQNNLSAKLIVGDACPLEYKRNLIIDDLKIADIKKWLFYSNLHLEDTLVNKIFYITKELCTEINSSYILDETCVIPTFTSVNGKKYRVETNMSADYFYLFASKDDSSIKEFVANQISSDFINGNKDVNDYLICSSTKDNGVLNLYLIGVNKDWSYEYVPFAKIEIDNIGPSIENINKNDTPKSVGESLGDRIADQLSRTNSNNLGRSRLSGNLNRLSRPDILVGTTDFSGDYPTFIFNFISSVEKVEIEYKGVKREVVLVGQRSPYYYTCYLPLNLGENNIAIKAYDNLGNASRTCIHTIRMVSVDDESDINIDIDNEINIYN